MTRPEAAAPQAPPPHRVLDGRPLSFSDMARLSTRNVRVTADGGAMARVAASRSVLEAAIRAGQPVYGANTGVGAMKDVEWSQEQLYAFNDGLVLAHHFGTGTRFSAEVVRLALAIRTNTLLTGHVGCTTDLVEALLALQHHDILPMVRRTGSIGCADIGLMGQIGAALSGAGEVLYQGRAMPSAEALAAAGLAPFRFRPRDSLAAISTNAVIYAAASLALVEAARAVRVLLATGLTALGAVGASRAPWHAATAVGSAREAAISDWLSRSTETWNWPKSTQVQDPLSVRMICQVFATGVESLLGAGRALVAATAQVDDNPVIAGEAVLTSGGSLPLDVSLLLQGTQLSLAHIARNTFNRCVLLGNGGRSLPVNLVPPEAGATGFGPMLKLAGDLFARLLSLSLPVSAQAMVVAGGMEDEAAFLPLIIERLEGQVAALKGLAAIEAILAAQAIYLTGDTPSGVAGVIHACVREHMAPYTVDRPLSAEIEAVEASLNGPALRKALLAASHLSDFDTFFSLDLFA